MEIALAGEEKAGYPILDVQEGKEFWKTSNEKRSRITTPFLNGIDLLSEILPTEILFQL
ncbi:hypothetical protein [Bacillus wiedmannii]|uniref:hypothetical protein n=1 Tax=Bacillus wiedmannii TaxID=1890302 RepID=UPI0015CF6E40|nr:hypothetical protein [Bacillus wiedmannii]